VAKSLRDRIDLTGVVLLGFFLSGASGLMYELVWVRMLGLIFGHTVHAITTVLVVFMGGLALGSYVCGRRSDQVRHLLRTYAWLEIGIGAYALLTPGLIDAIRIVYLSYARRFDPSFEVLTLIQFALSVTVLLVPTALMGATFPVLTRFVTREPAAVGRRVGALYAWNTFGAVAGTYLVGFHLLPAFGMRSTLFATAVLNGAIGVMILLAVRVWPETHAPVSHPEEKRLTQSKASTLAPAARPIARLMLGIALSGAVAMIYELAWTRALTLVIGSSTYAFTATLLSFLIGIAGGSAWASRRASRRPATLALFAGLQIAAGLFSLVVFALIDHLPDVFLLGFRFSHAPGFIFVLQITLSIVVMILPTFCLGATFPCVSQLVSTRLSRIGLDVSRVYASNTAGAILGSFTGGFLLIPLLGVQGTIRAAVVANLLAGLILFTDGAAGRRMKMGAAAAIVGGMVALGAVPNWNLAVMSSGVSTYAHYYAEGGASWRRLIGDRLLFYRDGISSTVTVHEGPEGRTLRVNGKTEAGTGADMTTQLLIGHIPALLHPDPKAALVIGLGSGVTVGAVTQHELDAIDVVEIEPAVIKASAFFVEENSHALADPRVQTTVADGRNFLFTTPDRYDLIVSEPSNPWIGGIATLFTVEFLEQARARLTSDGVMAQWVQGYAMAPEDLQMIAATFQTVFPHASLWMPLPGDFLLVGTFGPQLVDLGRIRDRLTRSAGLRQDFARSGLATAEAIFKVFALDEQDLVRLGKGATLNTDDLLPLEFSAPRNLYRDTLTLNHRLLQRVKQSRLPVLIE
jgi:spermidine synthase